jgi:hypothetical protein
VSFIVDLFFIVPGNQKLMSEMSNNGNGTLIGIIVGMSSALVVIVVVIVIVIKIKRNNEQGNK